MGEIPGGSNHPSGGTCAVSAPFAGSDLCAKYRGRLLSIFQPHLAADRDLPGNVHPAGPGGLEAPLPPSRRPGRPHPALGWGGGQSHRPGASGLCGGHVPRAVYGVRGI